jgi:hypothetical protein
MQRLPQPCTTLVLAFVPEVTTNFSCESLAVQFAGRAGLAHGARHSSNDSHVTHGYGLRLGGMIGSDSGKNTSGGKAKNRCANDEFHD